MDPMKRSALIVVALTTGTAACSIPSNTLGGQAIPAPQSRSTGATPITGTSFRDGSLEFTVLDTVRANQAGEAGNPALSIAAKGVYLIVGLSIRNVGTTPVIFLDRDQSLVDGTGATFAPSMAADIYANRGVRTTSIDPGGELQVRLAFDVPVDISPARLILRESGSSGGVAVPFR